MATATLQIRDVSDLEEQNAGGFYDEIEIEDMEYDEELETFFYPCPCGDRFQITVEEIEEGEEIARCPSCTLIIKVIYDEVCYSMLTIPCEQCTHRDTGLFR